MVLPEIAVKTGTKLITILAPTAFKEISKLLKEEHGSKVKMGAFPGCAIEMAGDKACIVADTKHGGVVFLTSDNIKSYRFVKEKERQVGLKRHTYYYYDIIFKDGSESYVRMRKKYVKAMKLFTPDN